MLAPEALEARGSRGTGPSELPGQLLPGFFGLCVSRASTLEESSSRGRVISPDQGRVGELCGTQGNVLVLS